MERTDDATEREYVPAFPREGFTGHPRPRVAPREVDDPPAAAPCAPWAGWLAVGAKTLHKREDSRIVNVYLHQLRTFCVVAEEENISRAAQRLFLSAPSVSAHIKALEDELGLPLFVRGSRGMSLTEAGHALWEDAEDVLARVDSMRQRAHTLADLVAGTLRIGINNPPETLRLNALIGRLSERHPSLRFETEFGPSRTILAGVTDKQLDVGFFEGPLPPGDLESVPLEQRRLILIAPSAWGEELAAAPVRELQRRPWIFVSEGCSYFAAGQRWSERHQLQLNARIRVSPDDRTTISLVADGLGLSIVSREALEANAYRDSVAILPQFEDAVLLSLAYRQDRKETSLVKAVLGVVRELWSVGDQPRPNASLSVPSQA